MTVYQYAMAREFAVLSQKGPHLTEEEDRLFTVLQATVGRIMAEEAYDERPRRRGKTNT